MKRQLITRFLDLSDIPALLQLESRQWEPAQAADGETLRRRLKAHPELCVGSFCAGTGEALASLFMKPINHHDLQNARCWADCAGDGSSGPSSASGCLFGISLTSVAPEAASALIAFFWPHALKNGWREIYVGSPMPGLRQALQENPALDADRYARSRRGDLPRDAQLRYYHQKGFREVVAVLPNYFPHEPSIDHGVLLRGCVPLSRFKFVWRLMPFGMLQALLGWIARTRPVPGRPATPSFSRKLTT